MRATTEAHAGAGTGETHLRYRPHLDGLRTLAVYLVVAFHAGLGRMSGGFIGVDIFFVLSGFLVTSILLRDLAASGRVSRRRFYSRRVRRILPAALATLVLTALAFFVIASPADVFEAMGGFRSACLFVANWYFLQQSTDYFAADVNSNPVLHFWSLAVEEQFYLLWPLVLGGLFVLSRRAGRGRWWVLRIAVAGLALASAIAALRIGHTDLDRAYYGTDTRVYQLLAGAFLALTPQLFRLAPAARRVIRTLAMPSLLALVAVATSAFSMSPITRGIVVTIFASLLIVALENSRAGAAKRFLSTRPMTYLGRVSYGTYLWHWPVIVLVTYERHISPLPLFAIAVVSATGLAILSYHALERPVRTSRSLERYKGPVIAVGFTASILVGLLLMPAVLGGGSATVDVAGAKSGSGTRLNWRSAFYDIPRLPDCLDAPASKCTIVRGTHEHLLLMGDSIARMWIPTFEKIAKERSLTLSIASHQGCPWQAGIVYQGTLAGRTACQRHRDDWYARVVSALHPDIILLGQHAYDDPSAPNKFVTSNGQRLNIAMPAFEPALRRVSEQSLRALRAPGRKLVILRPPPSPPSGFNPLRCLSTGKAPRSCGFNATVPPTPLERYFENVAADEPDVELVDLDRLLCPRFPRCDAVVRNMIAWRDLAHVTGTYAASLAPRVESILRHQAILAPKI